MKTCATSLSILAEGAVNHRMQHCKNEEDFENNLKNEINHKDKDNIKYQQISAGGSHLPPALLPKLKIPKLSPFALVKNCQGSWYNMSEFP